MEASKITFNLKLTISPRYEEPSDHIKNLLLRQSLTLFTILQEKLLTLKMMRTKIKLIRMMQNGPWRSYRYNQHLRPGAFNIPPEPLVSSLNPTRSTNSLELPIPRRRAPMADGKNFCLETRIILRDAVNWNVKCRRRRHKRIAVDDPALMNEDSIPDGIMAPPKEFAQDLKSKSVLTDDAGKRKRNQKEKALIAAAAAGLPSLPTTSSNSMQ